MIDLTPLDVRKKRGDFRKVLRGYDPEEVDGFLELVAERLEELVRENLTLRERTERLGRQVEGQEGREKAVQDALVTAQKLRDDIREQARREAEVFQREAEAEIEERMQEAQSRLEEAGRAMEALERRRSRFLKRFRQLLEEEMDSLDVEESRSPEEGEPVDLDLGEWRPRLQERVAARREAPAAPEGEGSGKDFGEESPDEPLWLSSLLEEAEREDGVRDKAAREEAEREERE